MPRSRPVIRPLLAAGGAVALVSLVIGGSGCEAPPGAPVPNQAPETFLSISGAEVDTTFYVLDLHWWGSDADGEVATYQFSWDGLWEPDPADTLAPGDSAWVETRNTERRFLILVRSTNASPVFSVRAIDDAGLADPTPVVQRFHVRNRLPVVGFATDLLRPVRSLPGVTFSLVGSDADGDDTIVGYRVWFDGEDPDRDGRIFPGSARTRIVLEPAEFPAGTGPVTVNVQARDETLAFGSVVARHTWEIVDPAGKRALLVDQHPDDFLFGAEVDAFYSGRLAAVVGPDGFVTIDPLADRTLQTADEIAFAFSTFDAVVWYSGLQPNNIADIQRRVARLDMAVDEIESFVRGGRAFLLQSTFAFGQAFSDSASPAAWDSLETVEFLGIPNVYPNRVGNSNFTLWPFDQVTTNTELGLAPLRPQTILSFVEMMPLPDRAVPLAWMPPGSLLQSNQVDNPVDYYCAFELPFPGGGRFTYLSFPLTKMNGTGAAGPFLDTILTRLLERP